MRFALPALLLALAPAAASAQVAVGHTPTASPYMDVVRGHTLTLSGGLMTGGAGSIGLGPTDGAVFALRYDRRLSALVGITGGVGIARLERLVAHPDAPVESQFTGPVDQSVTLADIGLHFNLTGDKSWHRLAPFIMLTGGFGFAQQPAADTTSYEFGTKFFFQPGVGTRFMLSPRLQLRAEALAVAWKLSYPSSFGDEPAEDPGTEEDPNAVIPDGRFEEWVLAPRLQIGIGYTF
jgi:hypothetical protein